MNDTSDRTWWALYYRYGSLETERFDTERDAVMYLNESRVRRAAIAAAAAPSYTGVATALRKASVLAARLSREIAADVERLKVDAARIDLSPLAAAFPAREARRGR